MQLQKLFRFYGKATIYYGHKVISYLDKFRNGLNRLIGQINRKNTFSFSFSIYIILNV